MQRWTPSAAATAPYADLYARWAEACAWRGFRRVAGQADGGALLRIAVRVNSSGAAAERRLREALACPRWTVPPLYHQPVPGSSKLARHFTATLPASELPWLATNPFGITWELAVPLRQAETALQADSVGRFGPTRDAAALSPPPLPRPGGAARTLPALLHEAVAVIDYGCPFLNQRFAGAGARATRLAALWDQDERALPAGEAWWQRPAATGYGRELDAAALAELYALAHAGPLEERIAEAALYPRIGYLVAEDDPRRRVWFTTHGAHVLDMAGGRHDPLLGSARPGTLPTANTPAADAAGNAPLLFVQLPSLTAGDSSGGSLSAQLLDGARYVLSRCTAEAKLVLNISYGTFAGPHDGSSLIETALDELLELRRRNFAITLGAGNGREAGCHVRRTVKPNRSALLRLALDPNDSTDTFVELWTAPPAGPQAPVLRLRVRTPDEDWSDWVHPGQQCALTDAATGQPVALLQHEHQVANGVGALALLALAPTAHGQDDEGPLAATGTWDIEVALADPETCAADAAIRFDAWVERDDPGEGRGGAQPRFVHLDRGDKLNTLSSLATGRHTVVVGGYRISDASAVGYSALPAPQADSARQLPPLVYAACEEDADLPGLPGAAVRSDEVLRMNGTSVAAPVLARRLFNHLARSARVDRADWPRVLQALAAEPGSFVRLP